MNSLFRGYEFFPVPFDLKKQMKCTKTPCTQKQTQGWHGCKKIVAGNYKSSQIRSASPEAVQLGCGHVILLEEIKCVNTFMRNTLSNFKRNEKHVF